MFYKSREPAGHQTPLHLAAMNGYEKVVRVLCREGKADANLANKVGEGKASKEGFTFSFAAFVAAVVVAVAIVVVVAAADVAAAAVPVVSAAAESALRFFCSLIASSKLYRNFLGKKCEKARKMNFFYLQIGNTPLMYAVREGHLGAASSLLDEGVSARDAEKGNPLHWEWSAAHWAAMGDDVSMLKMF